MLAEPLYVIADTAVLGNLGTTELGGLAVASAALLLIYGLCFFLAYGTTATVARLTGAGENQKAAEQAVQSLWLAFLLGILIAIIGYLAADPLLRVLGASDNLLEQARIYLKISMFGAPAMLLSLAGVGYLRGTKNTVRPLWVAITTAILNLFIEILLIYGLGYGIGASAISTVIAQWIGAAVYLFWIWQATQTYKTSFVPNFPLIKNLLKTSGDLFIRNLALTGSFITATSLAARLGEVDVAAHEVAFQAWFFLAMSMDAIAIAAQAMVGNLLGSGDDLEAKRISQRAIFWSAGIGLVLGIALLTLHTPLAGIFSNDGAVIELSSFLFLHVALMAPLAGVAFALDGILIGAGDQRFLAKAMVGSAAISIPLMLFTRLFGLGIGWIWGAIWILMASRSIILLVRFQSGKWKVVGV